MKMHQLLSMRMEDSIESSSGCVTVHEYGEPMSIEEFAQRLIKIAEQKDEMDVTIHLRSNYDEFLKKNIVNQLLIKCNDFEEEWHMMQLNTISNNFKRCIGDDDEKRK